MNSIISYLCPAITRNFAGKRWLQITLRTLHLIGIAGVSGGILLDVQAEKWLPYVHLTVLSGLSYFLLDVWSNALSLIQVRGIIILFKLSLLILLTYIPEHTELIFLVIIISSVISHAPGNIRYFSILHGRRVDNLPREAQ